LRNKLLVILLLITLVPLGILNYVNYRFLKDQLENDQADRLSGFSSRISKSIDILLNERINDIIAWTALETTQTALDIGGGQAGANLLFENMIKSYGTFDMIFLMNPSGTCIAASHPQALGVPVGEQGWFKQTLEGKSSVGDAGAYPLLKKLIPTSDGWSLLVAIPVMGQNEVRGVLAGFVKWEMINDIVVAFPVGETGTPTWSTGRRQ